MFHSQNGKKNKVKKIKIKKTNRKQKMADLRTNILIDSLNGNGLQAPIKRY